MSQKISWTKEDRNAWKNSEVFSQLEKNIIENLHKLSSGNYLVKSSQMKIDETAKKVEKLNQDITQVTEKLKNLADDGSNQINSTKDQEDNLMFHMDNPHLDTFDAGDKEKDDSINLKKDDIKDQIIDDLKCMAEEAIKEGNIKLAYQVERTIQEILDES